MVENVFSPSLKPTNSGNSSCSGGGSGGDSGSGSEENGTPKTLQDLHLFAEISGDLEFLSVLFNLSHTKVQ